MNETSIQRPDWKIILIYALGQFGWSLCAYGGAMLIPYFYMPPETADKVIFPTYIFQGALFGVITVIGLLTLFGRIFDGITDPLIANWSDRWKSKFGKRRPFMLVGAIPFAVFSVLMFVPLVDGEHWMNGAWLAFCVLAFFLFMTIYVTPFTAWMSELGHDSKQRLNIATAISVTWALGFGFGNSVHFFQGLFEASMTATAAFQTTMILFAGISLFFMLLPVIFINEKKYSLPGETNDSAFKAAAQVFKDANFRVFALSDFMYWMAMTAIQLGIPYYVTVLFQLEKETATLYMTILFAVSFLCYLPVNILARKLGKRKLVLFSFIIYSLVFIAILLTDFLRMDASTYMTIVCIVAAIPIAVFGILPNAIIADLAEKDSRQSGENKSGMYFGMRMLVMKLGISVTNFVFPALLILGKSVDNPFGVKMSALFAMVVCILGMIIFLKYKDVDLNNENE